MKAPSLLFLLSVVAMAAGADEAPNSPDAFAKKAEELRLRALREVEPRVETPTTRQRKGFPWKTFIITTLIFAGNISDGQQASAWDSEWSKHFGGSDDPNPKKRCAGPDEYRPAAFIPKLNPFYCALPYNDLNSTETKPEARTIIPWFRAVFEKNGKSVCRDRWVAIRNPRSGVVAYAQWNDAGPFATDHWQYVFGNARPLPNLEGGAGLSVSPSVRDFLGLAQRSITDWRFVELKDVPPGPWRKYGENNPFVSAQPDR